MRKSLLSTATPASLSTAVSAAVSNARALASRTWTLGRALSARVLRARPTRLAGLEALHVGHVEVDRLGRYLAVAALVAACLLVNAWSRSDLRRTSMDLDLAAARFENARAEQARLRLQLATLRDPARLDLAADQLLLTAPAAVVDLP